MSENTTPQPRMYILAPLTVQVEQTNPIFEDANGKLEPCFMPNLFKTVPMTGVGNIGRMMAQCAHVGRRLERNRADAKMPYSEFTTIVLSVRNSKELEKVSDEVFNRMADLGIESNDFYGEFHDENPPLYGSTARVHTITMFGPINPIDFEDEIGHLELHNG